MRELDRLDPFNIKKALDYFTKTRKVTPSEKVIQARDLEKALTAYQEKVSQDFGINLKKIDLPREFPTEQKYRKPVEALNEKQWYSSLERTRAYEVKRNYETLTMGMNLTGKTIADLGSRSNYFAALMQKYNQDQKWLALDIEDHILPTKANLRIESKIISPEESLPKADVYTINCVSHHVGEIEKGVFDDLHLVSFAESLHLALPENGLLIITEDYIGKNSPIEEYNNLIKGLDELFYPDSPGNQKPSSEWIQIFESTGLKLEKEEYLVGFNILGIPVVETCLLFKK